jgi:sulfatase maturation enzyme AslB (radical SAM superfamily)
VYSCRYLESGLSFYSDRITACGVIHHGTGMPELASYSGGPIPLEEIAVRRAELIRRNQIGCDSVCKGCPNLVREKWSKPSRRIEWLGITHFNLCNNACDYCWLQWAENGRGRPNYPSKSYAVIPAIDQLIDQGLLATDLTVDFGGGGEPTLMPEFDELLVRFTRYGAQQWIHTNCVRLPPPISEGNLDLRKVHIVCSIDAGSRETYRTVKFRPPDIAPVKMSAFWSIG